MIFQLSAEGWLGSEFVDQKEKGISVWEHNPCKNEKQKSDLKYFGTGF